MRATTAGLLGSFALVGVLAFVTSVAYLPHADTASQPPPEGPALYRLAWHYAAWLGGGEVDDYEHTVHVDENAHWVTLGHMQRADSLRYGREGESDEVPLSLRGLIHERGFHVALLTFQEMTGLPWDVIFRYLPAAWAAVTAWLLWAVLRPLPLALAAAALTAFVPTSPRFLGPGFLVPIGFSLAWLAAVLLLAKGEGGRPRAVGLLLVVVVWAFFIHLVAGFAALLLVVAAILFDRGERRGWALLTGLTLLPVLALFQTFQEDIGDELSRIGNLPLDFTAFDQIGVPLLLLWVLGCALVGLRPPTQSRVAVLAATAASLVVFALVVANLRFDLRLYALYDRWHQPFALLASVPIAYGAVTVGEIAAEALHRWRVAKTPPIANAATVFVAIGLLMGAADAGLQAHLREPYYHVLDDNDWATFQWTARNLGPEYEVFLTHPWKAPVLEALTGMEPYTWLKPGLPPVRGEDYLAHLAEGGRDAAWLVEHDISVVIDAVPPRGEEFEQVGPGVYALRPGLAQALRDARTP